MHYRQLSRPTAQAWQGHSGSNIMREQRGQESSAAKNNVKVLIPTVIRFTTSILTTQTNQSYDINTERCKQCSKERSQDVLNR